MKKCPECSRTYSDDTLSFCLEDGGLLSASYDPDNTQSPTVAISAPEIPPTVAAQQVPPTVARQYMPATVASNTPPSTVADQEIPTVVVEKPGETQKKGVRWYIYLAGFFIALVYNVVLTLVIVTTGRRVIYKFVSFFVDIGTMVNPSLPATVLILMLFILIISGSLAVMLGYRWPRAKWKWGVITALAEVPIASLGFYGGAPSSYLPFGIFLLYLIFIFLFTLAVGSAASYLGSRLREKRRN